LQAAAAPLPVLAADKARGRPVGVDDAPVAIEHRERIADAFDHSDHVGLGIFGAAPCRALQRAGVFLAGERAPPRAGQPADQQRFTGEQDGA
jgi:hypothetical protein